MSDNENDVGQSDEEYEPQAHKKLLQGVSRLGKTQHIKKPTRNEPALAQDEFHLVKHVGDEQPSLAGNVSVADLVKVLKKTSKHLEAGKKLRNAQQSKKILKKPLEKNVEDRIRRTVGYENTKKKLSRWDAIVTRNRSTDHQVFPLRYEEIHVEMDTKKAKPAGNSIKSDLMVEMEAVEMKLRELRNEKPTEETEDEHKLKQKLTRDELVSRRKELAYLRMKQQQKSAKARLQNKIKSKKYHKFLKREKLKEEMKEFELLQKTNPEAALEKLEKIEMSRVTERANLRHKNTGTWAKNLQVRAKYDKDVRKDLADQLALSRELTQKQKDEEDEESDAEGSDLEINADYDPFNPWVKKKKTGEESTENDVLMSSYRKYWIERNENEKALKEFQNGKQSADESEEEVEVSKFKDPIAKTKKKSQKSELAQHKKNKKRKSNASIESGWLVEDIIKSETVTIQEPEDIDDIFDQAEDVLQEKVARKLKSIRNQLDKRKTEDHKGKSFTRRDNMADLSFKKQAKRPEFDEELMETPANVPVAEETKSVPRLTPEMIAENHKRNEIDPTKFADIKPKRLNTTLPDMVNSGEFFDGGDDEANGEQSKQLTIAQAFEDDDIVADFEKDRDDERKKGGDEEVDLTLPGWGSWGGCGISNQRKTKRLVLKFPKDAPRRDDNKGNVYIKEDTTEHLKDHLVSDLPFPFTSVKDYEASIRAPIGRTFVPETAFRVLTRPAVVCKLGQVIEPMDEEALLKKPPQARNVVDRRVKEMQQESKKSKKH